MASMLHRPCGVPSEAPHALLMVINTFVTVACLGKSDGSGGEILMWMFW